MSNSIAFFIISFLLYLLSLVYWVNHKESKLLVQYEGTDERYNKIIIWMLILGTIILLLAIISV